MGRVPAFLLSEVAGKLLITIGVVCEIILRADFYLILITTGSLLISIGAELRLHKKRGD